MKFILLINVKMPTIVGILTFISRINTPWECIKQEKIIIFQYFSFELEKSFIITWPGFSIYQCNRRIKCQKPAIKISLKLIHTRKIWLVEESGV